ncbi:MAG: tRNA epoxyqueuosine(34) reductase QueG, partial [Nitrosomonas sp.]|nr:tRNA epoxyqueuosine(34) reductase QueG [Nitrosomonas sp.]
MQENTSTNKLPDYAALAVAIKTWGKELGFHDVRIADAQADMTAVESGLFQWLAQGYHGDMDYMAKHGTKRTRPAELEPGTLRVVSVCMNYAPPAVKNSWDVIHSGDRAFISRYALGRDYHKVIRARLQKLADRITSEVGAFQYRVFSDSAPVMEVAWAQKAGLGWRGKHTLLLNRQAGSMFFLGEMYVDLPLPVDEEVEDYCGSCTRCIDICPTRAIVAPYQVDARRCISYLTIEHKGPIPKDLRPLMGNHIYGCDDCLSICPWNKFAHITTTPELTPKADNHLPLLTALASLDDAAFRARFSGSP